MWEIKKTWELLLCVETLKQDLFHKLLIPNDLNPKVEAEKQADHVIHVMFLSSSIDHLVLVTAVITAVDNMTSALSAGWKLTPDRCNRV